MTFKQVDFMKIYQNVCLNSDDFFYNLHIEPLHHQPSSLSNFLEPQSGHMGHALQVSLYSTASNYSNGIGFRF